MPLNKPFVSHAARLKKFWSAWDEMAQKRKHILMKKRLKPAHWIQLDLNYRATNDMLINCPCPRFARAARLAKVDSTRSLLTPSCSIYALLEKFRTYVGQVGARAKKRKRAFMEHLKGHFQKAKALRAAYHCGKVRKRKANPFMGSAPSLPRLLAMHGTHQTTMLPMEDASPAELDSVENKVE